MNGIGAFFMAVLIAYGSFVSVFINPEAPGDTGEFTPVTGFIVTSDSHIATIGDVQTTRLKNLPEGEYTPEIVANNCCGMQSGPLT